MFVAFAYCCCGRHEGQICYFYNLILIFFILFRFLYIHIHKLLYRVLVIVSFCIFLILLNARWHRPLSATIIGWNKKSEILNAMFWNIDCSCLMFIQITQTCLGLFSYCVPQTCHNVYLKDTICILLFINVQNLNNLKEFLGNLCVLFVCFSGIL